MRQTAGSAEMVEPIPATDREDGDTTAGVLAQLRAYLSSNELPGDGRLPPERLLADLLGVTRSELRKGLATLESEGVLWRHVGKGTFVGQRPPAPAADLMALARKTNPQEVMVARIALEPQLARLAALNATAEEISRLRDTNARCREAASWRHYETLDATLHHHIARASHNTLLLGLVDVLNTVRRTVTWGRLRQTPTRPPVNHHSFAEHDRIIDAIASRDLAAAEQAMRVHLETVARKLAGESAMTL
jgi:DNA-binding FadR family transcriptional regulator